MTVPIPGSVWILESRAFEIELSGEYEDEYPFIFDAFALTTM